MIKLQFPNKFQKKYLELEFIQLQYSIPKHCSQPEFFHKLKNKYFFTNKLFVKKYLFFNLQINYL